MNSCIEQSVQWHSESKDVCVGVASDGPECGDASGLQPTQVGLRHPTADGVPLTTWNCPHSVQLPSANLQNSSWICSSYLNSLVGVHLSPHQPCSTNEHHLIKPPVPTQQSTKRVFSCLVPQWCNGLHLSVRTGTTPIYLQNPLKREYF